MLQPIGALKAVTHSATDIIKNSSEPVSKLASQSITPKLSETASHAAEGAQLISNGMPSNPRWYKDSVFYQARVDSFMDGNADGVGDFAGLAQRMDHVQDVGADAIWLTPFNPSGGKDGGYDITDFMAVDPKFGTMKDFESFVDSAHKNNVRVVTELVLNHTSDKHKWFTDEVKQLKSLRESKGIDAVKDLADKNKTRYVWDFSKTKEQGPPERWKDTRVIFNDYEPSNWTYNDDAGGWYWHRFFKEQPDLNWENENVVKEMSGVLDFWMDKGVDGIRLDAVPYLFEEAPTQITGTTGENLQKTHDMIRQLRSHIDSKYDSRMLLGEANMPAEETLAYFGKGNGDEAHTLFNFPLMPRLYMGTLFGDKKHVIDGLNMTGDIPKDSAWLTFLRNHDETTFEKVTDKQRQAVWDIYRKGRAAEGIEADPNAPINLGVRLRLSDLMGHDPRRIEMMKSMLYSQPGTPIEYYGDEIGMATLRTVKDASGKEIVAPDRFGVRTTMQWDNTVNGGYSAAHPDKVETASVTDARYAANAVNVSSQRGVEGSMLEKTKALIAARKSSEALRKGSTHIVDTSDDAVIAYRRSHGDENVLAITNLTGKDAKTKVSLPEFNNHKLVRIHGSDPAQDLNSVPEQMTLKPYEYQWYKLVPNE